MNANCIHYDSCRIPAQKCNAKCEFSKIPQGWSVVFNPKPMPDRRFDYDFVHEDYDYCSDAGSNGLCGNAESIEDAVKQIKEIEAVR